MKTVEDNGFTRDRAIIQARARVRNAVNDQNVVEWVMTQVAQGKKMVTIARALDVDYSLFHQMMKARYSEKLAAARAARAEDLVEKNLELADDIQEGLVDAKAGNAAAGIRQWYAERADADQWGRQSTTNVNVKGVIGLHLEAIQHLANVPLEGEVEDVEIEEVEDEAEGPDEGPAAGEEVPDSHPLL